MIVSAVTGVLHVRTVCPLIAFAINIEGRSTCCLSQLSKLMTNTAVFHAPNAADAQGLTQALRTAKSGAQLPAALPAQRRRAPRCLIRTQAALDKQKASCCPYFIPYL